MAHLVVELGAVPYAPAAQLRVEQQMFESLAVAVAAAVAPPRLRVWEPLPALIATAAEAKLETFAVAASRAAERGLPVHVRHSGGGAVSLGPGMLVVTHLYSCTGNDIDESYRRFARCLVAAMRDVGVDSSYEHVQGAYCDGKFDLACRGRKLGGIAQRRRVLGHRTHVWVHAVLAIERMSLSYPAAVAQFYADLGSARLADPRRTTCLADCLSPRPLPLDLLKRCSEAISRSFCAQAVTKSF